LKWFYCKILRLLTISLSFDVDSSDCCQTGVIVGLVVATTDWLVEIDASFGDYTASTLLIIT